VLYRLAIVVIIAMTLMVADSKFNWLAPLKSQLLTSTRPLYEAVDLPTMVGEWASLRSKDKNELSIALAKMESENLILRAKLQKMTALTIENVRLRELLNATSLFEENVLVAEIISTSPDVNSHHVVLNKGSKQGVYIGQAVVDAYGLFGQVVEVGESIARVLLISDERHSVPVQVNRNGLRFIVEGMNTFNELRMPHIASTSDVKEGDILSTSGLGQLFPSGYPVAKVSSIKHSDGEPFADVQVRPFAHLNQSRHVLLLFSELRQQIAQPDLISEPETELEAEPETETEPAQEEDQIEEPKGTESGEVDPL